MKETIKNAILASFVADTFALGVHWVYDRAVIKDKYGRVETLVNPEIAPFHRGKGTGDFTHYGDQMLVLLESVKAVSIFDVNDFSDRWQNMFAAYSGWMDQATKGTRANLAEGLAPEKAGSNSTDLAGASRIVPLFSTYSGDLETLEQSARTQTAMTHSHPDVVDAAVWAVHAGASILEGQPLIDAVQSALEKVQHNTSVAGMVVDGLESRNEDTSQTIGKFGQMCEINAALPSAVHLAVKYNSDYRTAMIENVMAGGDSAARGTLAGFLIACGQTRDFIPEDWLSGMRALKRIELLLKD